MATINWWIAVAIIAAVLAGGALRLGLARNWARFGGVVLLGTVAVFAAWSEGRTLEVALGVAGGAMFLGFLLPDIVREVAQGIIRFVRWLTPIVVGFAVLAYLTQTIGPDRVGELLANLIAIAILVTVIRLWFRSMRHRRNGERR